MLILISIAIHNTGLDKGLQCFEQVRKACDEDQNIPKEKHKLQA